MFLFDQNDAPEEIRVLLRNGRIVGCVGGREIIQQFFCLFCGPGIRTLVAGNEKSEPIAEDVFQIVLFTDDLECAHCMVDGILFGPVGTRRRSLLQDGLGDGLLFVGIVNKGQFERPSEPRIWLNIVGKFGNGPILITECVMVLNLESSGTKGIDAPEARWHRGRSKFIRYYPHLFVLFQFHIFSSQSPRTTMSGLPNNRYPVTTNQGFKSFVPGGDFSTDYIYFTLKHFMRLIKANASGSTFKEISGRTLKAVRIHLPPVDLVAEFTEHVSSLSSQQSLLEQQHQQLTELRDWLLPMLMNGQVTVD